MKILRDLFARLVGERLRDGTVITEGLLEREIDPIAFLRNIHEDMAPGDELILKTPSDPMAAFSKQGVLHSFTENSLRIAIAKAGFKRCDISVDGPKFICRARH